MAHGKIAVMHFDAVKTRVYVEIPLLLLDLNGTLIYSVPIFYLNYQISLLC